MLALEIILGIILFFVILLSIRLKVSFHKEDKTELDVKWLFLKFHIVPKQEKKPKKPKKEKAKKKEPKKEDKKPGPLKEEEIKEETPEENSSPSETADKKEKKKSPKVKKDKSNNIFYRFYYNNGVSGTLDLLKRVKEVLSNMAGRIARSFVVEELIISLTVGAGDSAETAIKYGKTCAEFYPITGYLTGKLNIRKYNFEVMPDFINGKSKARLHGTVSFIPRKFINGLVVTAVEAVFKVVIKFLKGSKRQEQKPGTSEQIEDKNKTNNKCQERI